MQPSGRLGNTSGRRHKRGLGVPEAKSFLRYSERYPLSEVFISSRSSVNTMNNPASKGSLLSLQVGDANSTGFKSIQKVIWDDIPSFAVLTGPNGAGKTQLLQILAYKLSQTQYDQAPTLNALPINISGDTIGPHEIAYLPSVEYNFGVQGSSIGTLQQQKQNFLQQLAPESTRNNIDATILRHRVERQFGIRITSQQDAPRLAAKLPDDFVYMLNYSDVSASLI